MKTFALAALALINGGSATQLSSAAPAIYDIVAEARRHKNHLDIAEQTWDDGEATLWEFEPATLKVEYENFVGKWYDPSQGGFGSGNTFEFTADGKWLNSGDNGTHRRVWWDSVD